MHVEEQYTPKTWPEAPERATLEGKNKFLGFLVLSWRRNSFFRLSLCNIFGSEEQSSSCGYGFKRFIYIATCVYYDNDSYLQAPLRACMRFII